MTETDLEARLRSPIYGKDVDEVRQKIIDQRSEAADTLARQRERIAELEEALEAIERGDDSVDGMAADIARAVLSPKQETANG